MGSVLNLYANRGRALEDLITTANQMYQKQGIAVIRKVPTEWLPIRNGSRIVSAKVEKKASVDFLGVTRVGNETVSLAFDAKEVSRGDRWPLKNLEPHQYEFLKDYDKIGAFSFVLVGFWKTQKFFVIPFHELEKRWTAWKSKTGPASVRDGEEGLVEVKFFDYLGFLKRLSV